MNHRHYMQVLPGIHCIFCHKTYSQDRVATAEDISEHRKTCDQEKEITPCVPSCGRFYKHKCPMCGQDVQGE